MTRPREVALLGGSFNPPHVGHAMVALWVLATQPVDELWLLPSFAHPFGKPLAPWADRVRMCELAIAGVRGASVCTAEADLADDPLVGKTARTLEHLRDRYPGTRFSLVVGADIVPETSRWYRFDRVKELARLIVVGRQGHAPIEGAPAMPEVSSTAIREAVARGRDVAGLVPRSVAAFISERGLYRQA